MKTFYLLPFVIVMFSACVTPVQPWEKETLAKEAMSEAGTNPLLNSYEEHIYFSKEASQGGSGVAGGGCGCN